MKTIKELKRVLEKHRQELESKFKVSEIGIFGSYVRETQTKISDVDILVKIDDSISLLDLVKIENYLTSLLGVKVDLIPKEDLRQELRERILKETIYV